MDNWGKKIKSGLKKCPLHKFGATYVFVKDRWYQCNKCKAYHEIDELMLGDVPDREIKIKPTKVGVTYEFSEYLGARIKLKNEKDKTTPKTFEEMKKNGYYNDKFRDIL